MAVIITPKIKKTKKQRLALIVYLTLLVLLPVGIRFASIFAIPSKNPNLRMIMNSVHKLEPLIKNKERVVWIDEPMSLYMAGRVSYYPLINHTGFYKPSNDTAAVKALGFWNQAMLADWLEEADLVVIGANKLKLLKEAKEAKDLARFIEVQLAKDFELIEIRTDIWPGEMAFYQPKQI